MKKQLHIGKVKDGKEQRLLIWLRSLNDVKDEVLETLVEEEVVREEWWYFTVDNQMYIACTIDGEAKPSNKHRWLNREHVSVLKECVDFSIPSATCLFDGDTTLA